MASVTIRDVARKAGVGLGTVSRVINDSPFVSVTTRERVLSAIAELNFRPNPTARRLSLGKTLTIAVVVPFFTRPAFVERLRGVENSLAESAYDLVLYNVETPERRDRCFRQVAYSDSADGVIILSLPPKTDDVAYLEQATVPIVLVDANHPSLTGLNRIIVDDVEGGRQAVQHLLSLGHRRIGYLCDRLDSPFNFTSSADRYRGYQQALAEAGVPERPEYFAQGEHDRRVAQQLAQALLALPEPPTAIFAASDTQALGVLEAARQAGRQVPGDLSVIGYDDIEVAEYLGLTTIRQEMFASGQQGVELLLRILGNPDSRPVCRTLPTELIVRRTTAPPRS